ncbi:hypothetical protein BH11PLA2_BH11PLA2_23420 [soil metagenome]
MVRFNRWWPKALSRKSLRRPTPLRNRLHLCSLEDRCVPATFVVNSTADTGVGTLRNQIAAANAAAGTDTISFDATVFTSAKTITLTTGEIAITTDLTVDGPDQILTISGNNSSRIFNINGAGTLAVGIQDVTLTKGVTAGVNDGAAVFIQDEIVTFTNCTLTANSSSDAGGAIRVEATGILTLSGCTISANTATSSGGALSLPGTPTVSLNSSTFASNTAAAGGGLNMSVGGSLTVSGCTFSANNANTGDGGGMFLNGAFTTASIRNSTYSGNFAASDGGAIALSSSFTTLLTLHNCTVASNVATAGNGGGIARTSGTATVSLVSTIIFSNSAGTTADNLFSTGTVNATLCIISNTTGVTTFNGDTFTDAHIGQNPGLGSLASNGGLTKTLAITAGSIAENAGSNVLGLTTDQRGTGYFRVRGTAADIGSFEIPDDFIVTNTNNSGTGSLRQAILDSNAAVGLDTITFDPAVFTSAKTITMSGGEMLISEGVIIDGPTAELTINANNTSRIFRIEGTGPVLSTIRDLRLINGNVTGANDGGAILVAGAGGVQTYTNLDFASNDSADLGGAIAIMTSSASVTVDGCDFDANTAATGGAVFLIGGAGLTIRNSSLHGNSAASQGGAIAVFGNSAFSVTNSTLSGNTATTGGGISWNTSGNNNTINNSTITGNIATGGGGVFAFAGVTNFASTIVSGNSGTTGPDIASPGTTNVNNSAIGSGTGFTLTGANNLAFGTNLLLGTLASNGGNGPTHMPAVNSPVLGKGSNGTGLTLDQRGTGFPRSRGGSVDIGAVEVPAFVVVNTSTSGAGSLSQAVIDANAAGGTDTISFDPTVFATTQTIVPAATLTSTDDLIIIGPTAKVNLSGNGARRIFQLNSGDFSLSNATLLLGSATSDGGAVQIISGNSVNAFTNCTMSFNTTTTEGGAIGIDTQATVTITDCTFSSNSASGANRDGGAIHAGFSVNLTITGSTLTDNTAAGDGGAVSITAAFSSLLVQNSSIYGNTASRSGGGLSLTGDPGAGGLKIVNSTLSGNKSTQDGGGISWLGSGGTLTIQNSTITLNTASGGGGGGVSLVNVSASTLSLESTIISGNTNAGAPDIDNPNTTNQKTSAVGSNLGYAKTDLGGNVPFGASLFLGPLTSNGGPTLNHLPGAGSPLIEGGSNPAGLTLDQRGFPRTLNGFTDIGSVETVNTIVTNTNDSGFGSLRQVILDTNAVPGTQTITFHPTVFATAKTITLTSGELIISDDVTIAAPAVGVTVSGNNTSRVLNISNVFAALTVEIDNMTLMNGKSTNGGAIILGDETLTLNGCIISNNTSILGGGGGIFVQSSGTLVVDSCTITGNTTPDAGGGIGATSSTTVTIFSSAITGNSAGTNGGGLLTTTGSVVTVRNSTIANNTATTGGGLNLFESATNSLGNNTIVNNVATGGQGGGIFAGTGTLNVESSIVSGNTGASGPDIFHTGTSNVNASAIGSATGFTVTGANNLAFGTNLLLGPLANNGGPTLTMLPAVTSPVVNKGSNLFGITLDQRGTGFPRVNGSTIDIGAVETHIFVVTNINNSGSGSLRQAVLDSNADAGPNGISFDPTVFATAKTITLTSGEVAITDSVTILGPTVGVTVSGNNAGRIFNIAAPGVLTVAIADVAFSAGNVGAGQSGGALLIADETVTLSRSTFTGNNASVSGGAIRLNGGKLTIESSSLFNNSSNSGGAISVDGTAELTLRSSTLSGNSVGGSFGGAISTTSGSAVTMLIQNSTITANTANLGGGAIRITSAGGTLTIDSSIVSGNVAPTDSDINVGIVFATNSAFGSNNGFIISGSKNLPNGTNLKLGALADNGGPTFTHLPAVDSPLVDAGSNPALLTSDQRGVGFNRSFGGGIDIGAVESRAITVRNTNDSGTGSLRQSVLEAESLAGPDAITFDPIVFATPQTIALTSGVLFVTDSVAITGPAAGATISGNQTFGLFSINGIAVDFSLTGVTLTKGSNFFGGALYYQVDGGTLALSNCTLIANTAGSGGGAVALVGNGGSFTATDCKFQGNHGGIFGGAIDATANSTLAITLLRCDISGNTAASAGGIYLQATGTIDSSTISNNKATGTAVFTRGGGGLRANNSDVAGSVVVRNSTISGNSSAFDGGGTYLSGFIGTFLVQNSTIANNTAAGNGGGISRTSGTASIALVSTIAFGNAAPTGTDLFITGTVTATTSLIGSKSGVTTFIGDTFTNANIGVNPLLGPLANNGGPTLTHLPAIISPGVNKGINPGALSTDQRGSGFNRSFGGGVDIGAVESRALIVTTTNDSGTGSLRQALLDANAVAGADTITFDPTVFATAKTISLLTQLPAISDHVSILGTSATLLTVQRDATAATPFLVFRAVDDATPLQFTLADMTIKGGSATSSVLGGGVFVSDSDTATLERVIITGNNGSLGAGIRVFGGTLFLRNSTVSNNTGGAGGGIYGSAANITIENSILTGNSASNGGGLELSSGSTGFVRNSTFSANTATNNGGAIHVVTNQPSALTLQNTTVTANNSGISIPGGGSSDSIVVTSSIVSGNGTSDFISGSATVQLSNSAIGSSAGLTFTDLGGNLAFGTNLKLGALANNGGTTLTHLPAIDSPLRDAGSNPASLTNDQRGSGFNRVWNGVADIGAVELAPTFIVLTTNDAGPGSLRQTILDANAIAGANAITFAPTAFASSQIITLTSGELFITGDTTVTGPSVRATISGNNTSRVLRIDGIPALTVALSNLIIRDAKTSLTGAGISLTNDALTLTNCSVIDNTTTNSGGGINVTVAGGSLTLIDCTVADNQASRGGGIEIFGTGSTLLVVGSTISGNSSTAQGGGIFSNSDGAITLRNSTMSTNFSSNVGGGISLTSTAPLVIENCTFDDNVAFDNDGDTIFRFTNTPITIVSSILHSNLLFPFNAQLITTLGTVNASSSMITRTSGITSFNGDTFTNANIGVNPQLGPLADNGGPTFTHLPAFTSPAINNGSNPATLTTDQRGTGFVRSFAGGVDIGAVEVHTFVVTNTSDSGAGSLRQAILDSNVTPGTDTIIFEATFFSSTKFLTLLSATSIADNVTITGPGKSILTIFSGSGTTSIFSLGSVNPLTVTISGMQITGATNAIVIGDDALTLDSVSITGSKAISGGAVLATAGSSLTILNSSFSNNSASNVGGAISVSSGSAFTMTNSNVAGNTATNQGGGISIRAASVLIESSTISGNSAGGLGGGVYFQELGNGLTLRNVTVSGNTASNGGGITIFNSTSAAAVLNSTITANSATSSGGGVSIANATNGVSFESTILSGNTAVAGPDLHTSASVTLKASALGTPKSGVGTFVDGGGNLPFGSDLRLAPLASNGGPTPTHALLNGSAAVNAGSNPAGLVNDQRGSGFGRSVGTAPDIGAFEFQGLSFVVNGGATQRSRVTTITVTFVTAVNVSTLTGLGAITFTRTLATPSGTVGTVVQTGATGANGRILVSPASGLVQSVTLTFDNANGTAVTPGVESGSLSDGRWQLAIPSQGFTSTLNDPTLRRLYGDFDANGTVNGADLVQFGNAFGSPGVAFDYDNNGTVNGADLAQFGNGFGTTL